MGIDLFDGSDDTDVISKIETNKEFAKRYEHNKKREDLHRLEELKKKGLVDDSEDSSSESEDDDEEHVVNIGKKDIKFFDALVRVKKKDPIIKQPDAKLFESDSEEEGSEGKGEEENHELKKKKPVYLKDANAKQLLEKGPEYESESDYEFKENKLKRGVKSYSEEQSEIRKAFLNAVDHEGSDDEPLLKEKKKPEGENDEEATDEIHKMCDTYFGEDDNLDDKEKFLKNFFVNKMWVDKDKGKKPVMDMNILSEDEEEVEKQERYEAEFNFRHEEEDAGDRIPGHARVIDGLRKKTNPRARQRKSKEERMAQAEFQRQEELKHLKNLKKKEINERLEKIRAMAGIADEEAYELNKEDLEEDFDPEKYDQKMKKIFNHGYYDKEDADFEKEEDDDIEKPDFDKEDELLGLPKDWDVCGSGDGFTTIREKVLKSKSEMKDDDLSEDSDKEEEEVALEGKRKRKRKMSAQEKDVLEQYLDEYNKLDYEDVIGDLKTRFKYASVPSQKFGLNAEVIINMDEKELNQYVPLKKIAPYREDAWAPTKAKKQEMKTKWKALAQGLNPKDQKSTSKHGLKVQVEKNGVEQVEKNGEEQVETNGEVRPLSRKQRRRQNQADLKLSQSRLSAYDKIHTKSKNKKKH